jgi:hypothetical protein
MMAQLQDAGYGSQEHLMNELLIIKRWTCRTAARVMSAVDFCRYKPAAQAVEIFVGAELGFNVPP